MKTKLSIAILLACLSHAAIAAEAGPDTALVAKCESCHGPGGASRTPETPRLNGQNRDYLLMRLKEFADPTRNTPHATYQMWERATSLGDRVAAGIAAYFAGQPPTQAAPAGALAAAGEKIYRQGVGAQVPACQQCHGAAGEGAGVVPRLAGQHAAYLEQQLSAFMLGVRVSPQMNKHAWHLDPDQFKAISAYLARD
jgi:cytochrome c553